MVCRRYRPRQPRASPVWQVFRHHWPAYLIRQEAGTSAKHGPLAAPIPSAVTAFLRCGDLHAGFTRLRCTDCRHEYLLAFTCKQRGLCAACHQRRVLTEAPFIAEEVCAAVPHRPSRADRCVRVSCGRSSGSKRPTPFALSWSRSGSTNRPPARPLRPRRRAVAMMGPLLIDAVTDLAYPAGPQSEPKPLDLPRSKTDPLYHRQWMLAPEADRADDGPQSDAADDFDQTGFELPPWRDPPADPRQALLFADYAGQTDPPDGEPVFMLADTTAEPADDFAQPDAPDNGQ